MVPDLLVRTISPRSPPLPFNLQQAELMRMNAEIERETAALVSQADEVLRGQAELLSASPTRKENDLNLDLFSDDEYSAAGGVGGGGSSTTSRVDRQVYQAARGGTFPLNLHLRATLGSILIYNLRSSPWV